SADHLWRRVSYVGAKGLERRAELRVGFRFLTVHVKLERGGESDNHHRYAYYAEDVLVVGLCKLLEPLVGGSKLVLLQFPAGETVQGLYSLTGVNLARSAATPHVIIVATCIAIRQCNALADYRGLGSLQRRPIADWTND